MYASDKTINSLLSELNIVTNNSDNPFIASEQIQPCSIDLRLDSVFWKPIKRKSIDLRKSQLLEIQPSRFYKNIELKPSESIKIESGELLLGRIYEEFSIPSEFAGEIIGRSSFARLGLLVHTTGSFINPGWRGHMPLQLVNFSRNALIIFPYIPICQLRLVKIDTKPSRLYGEKELWSKYMNDDGSPYYWWRDKRIILLQERLKKTNMDINIQQELSKKIGRQDPEIIERLETFIDQLLQKEVLNAEDVLEKFSQKEEKRKVMKTICTIVPFGISFAILSVCLGSLFYRPLTILHYLFFFAFFIFLIIAYLLYKKYSDLFFLGKKELNELRNANR
ncbi:MAG: dCTP deaminase [candidate division Zixibacteria bacterium]|nr:dCTP deaminase [Candidatus Tariuqbacter arcticus]